MSARWVLRALLVAGAGLGATKASAAAPAEPAPKAKKADPKPKEAEKATSEPKAAPSKPDQSKPEAKPMQAKTAEPKVGPQRGAGSRSVEVKGSLPEVLPPSAAEKTRTKTSHKKGAPPKKPSPSLPAGATRPKPDANGRRLIAEGATDEDLRAGKDDPELRSLREAERVLFPQALPGVETGWSWHLPTPPRSTGPEVVASGLPPEAKPGLDSSSLPAADAAWLKTLALPNLPVRFDEHVVKYLRFYRDSPSGRSIAKAWAKKSGRYLAAIRAEFAKAGLPSDLVWLSLIESGHNPTITSPAGAAGLWQFMPDAGRTYGLAIDRWVDERLDPERSTLAAGRFLSDLYRRFGNWDLAMAAYNMGHGGLSRAIRKFNTNSFWELARYEAGIPWETTLYVPKILATAIVMSNRRAFGLEGVSPDPADSFDVVLVGSGVPLEEVASAAGVALSTIEALNPQYLAGRTPPSQPGASKISWRVRVPAGRAIEAGKLLAQASDLETLEPYSVRFGETVESIALTRGTTEARIRSLNRVDPKEALAPGTTLLVPKPPSSAVAEASSAPDVVVIPPREFRYPDKKRIFYRVLATDTVAGVGRAFQVGSDEIVTWNALDETARLHSGMVLQLFVDKNKDLTGLRHLTESKARVLVAGTPEFCDYFEGLNGKKRVAVTVKEGDTLLSIGRRHGTSIGWMERINRRSRNDKLKAGETLIVYTERAPAAPAKTTSKTLVSSLSSVEPPYPAALPEVDSTQPRIPVSTGN